MPHLAKLRGNTITLRVPSHASAWYIRRPHRRRLEGAKRTHTHAGRSIHETNPRKKQKGKRKGKGKQRRRRSFGGTPDGISAVRNIGKRVGPRRRRAEREKERKTPERE